ncbi:MAG: hypothetical protein MJZ25_13635 [Fibrobacter sp.]|nr:hypothetical protein [Fibrobacter sp.]
MSKKNKNDIPCVEESFDEMNPVGPFKCRHCGEKSEYSYDKTSSMYGSPLVVCSQCKSEQLVLGRIEPALYDKFRYITNYKVHGLVLLFSLLGGVAAYFLYRKVPGYDDLAVWIICCIPTLFSFAVLSLLDVWKSEKKRGAVTILKKSQARMKNPDYVRMLLDLGHEVPRKLWPKDYKPKPIFKKQKPTFVKQ